jgi:hypothetical protein
MDIDPRTLSIFVTVLVIIAAMGMALIVDLLKGNVEQLRETAIDLKARKDAAERHARVLERQITRSEATTSQALTAAPRPVPALLAETARSAADAQPKANESEVQSRKESALTHSKAAAKQRGMSPAVAAVAESVAARMAAGGFSPTNAAAAAAGAPPAAVSLPPLRAGQQPSAAATAARKNWSEILRSQKHGQADSAEGAAVNNLIQFSTLRGADGLPAGYHEYAVLQRLAASGQAFTGLVIAIGTNALDRMQVGLVGGFLRSLLEEKDFGCLSGAHEFVLICPNLDGEGAQRRLASVAEKLWDFQLRSMGSIDVQFAWGGKEARNDSLNEAVAAATEQMQETRRSRPHSVASQSTIELQQAV